MHVHVHVAPAQELGPSFTQSWVKQQLRQRRACARLKMAVLDSDATTLIFKTYKKMTYKEWCAFSVAVPSQSRHCHKAIGKTCRLPYSWKLYFQKHHARFLLHCRLHASCFSSNGQISTLEEFLVALSYHWPAAVQLGTAPW